MQKQSCCAALQHPDEQHVQLVLLLPASVMAVTPSHIVLTGSVKWAIFMRLDFHMTGLVQCIRAICEHPLKSDGRANW